MSDPKVISLSNLPADIIRIILTMTADSFKMRAISPEWNDLILSGRYLLMDKVDLSSDFSNELIVNLRLLGGLRSIFCPKKRETTFPDTGNSLKIDPKGERVECNFELSPFSKFLGCLSIASAVLQPRRYTSAIFGLSLLSLWNDYQEMKWGRVRRENMKSDDWRMIGRDHMNRKLINIESVHRLAGNGAATTRMKLKELFNCSFCIKTLWVENVNKESFDVLRDCVGTVRIKRLIVRVANGYDQDVEYITAQASKINAMHRVIV